MYEKMKDYLIEKRLSIQKSEQKKKRNCVKRVPSMIKKKTWRE